MGLGSKGLVKKGMMGLGEMGFNTGGGAINWFPGHMAAATRAIRDRLKLADFVIEVRDARIPLSSANQDLQPQLRAKRSLIVLNKKDLANTNIMQKWTRFFESSKQDCLPINAHSRSSVSKLLDLVEYKLKEAISREPTLLVMVVGVPNVGKSALINNIHRIASSRFPGEDEARYSGSIAWRYSGHCWIQGVLVPSIPDIETGLKLALAGSIKDSVVGEDRIAQYLLAVLNSRGTPFHWKYSNTRRMEGIQYEAEGKIGYSLKNLRPNRRKVPNKSDVLYIEDMVTEVQRALYSTLSEFNGNPEDESDLEILIEQQFEALQTALKIPNKGSEARLMVSKKFLTLFRSGKLGTFILDDVPDDNPPS
ncbi:short integuments 2, mitochondrial-like isoform X2 [Malus domestica]|uniref:short integuments 2, mitochondrial-like isoform X2 n=1 Tax=Malus domestica TaxID=3750 RepID=UPI0010AA2F72|nr:short integuments 2, mitochondrial-like isoform X2 [Malus domestica]